MWWERLVLWNDGYDHAHLNREGDPAFGGV